MYYVLTVIFILYFLMLMGRKNHPKMRKLRGWSYAHRGLHGNGVPENSMDAFRRALEKGYGIELDVHLLKDGGLAVIHDAALHRTTGAEGVIEDLTTQDLANYRLEGTEETIPTLQQVLELFDGKAPLIIELKAEKGNHDAMAQTVCQVLEGYKGAYCIESFDPRCLMWLRKKRPNIIRGQLSENFLRAKDTNLSWPLRLVLTSLVMNVLTKPDFIAYKFEDRTGLSPLVCKKIWKIQSVSWTLRSQEDLDIAVAEGSLPIFEYFEP